MDTPSAPQTPITTDVVVIGGGPAGLFQVFQLGLQGLKAHVVDALPHPGGQCAELYGDKPIYDIPGIPVCTGHSLIQQLQQQVAPFAPQWHLGQAVTALQPHPQGGHTLCTARGTPLHARAVILATGVGAFMPRTLALPGLSAFEGSQLHYHLPETASVAGQHVVIHGGGEPAVALAIALATAVQPPASTTLHHRRDVFDAEPAALAQLQALREAGRIQVAIGMAQGLETQQGRLTALQLTTADGSPKRLPLDTLIVRLGLVPRLGPIADWGLALERKQLVVNPATCATPTPGIYAIGDAITYPGKRKLIVSAFHEATLAAFATAEWLAGHPIPLEYTSSSERLQQRLGVRGCAVHCVDTPHIDI